MAPVDAPAYLGRCGTCQPGETCIIDFDGVGNVFGAHCVAASCTTCTPECEAICEQDNSILQCQDSVVTLEPGYFGCYGP